MITEFQLNRYTRRLFFAFFVVVVLFCSPLFVRAAITDFWTEDGPYTNEFYSGADIRIEFDETTHADTFVSQISFRADDNTTADRRVCVMWTDNIPAGGCDAANQHLWDYFTLLSGPIGMKLVIIPVNTSVSDMYDVGSSRRMQIYKQDGALSYKWQDGVSPVEYAEAGVSYTFVAPNSMESWNIDIQGDLVGIPPQASSTRIVSQNFPRSSDITPSTSVTFDFDYYYGADRPEITQVGYTLVDHTGSETLFTLDSNMIINANGLVNYTDTRTLTSGHLYTWRAVMMNDDNEVLISSAPIFFSVVSQGTVGQLGDLQDIEDIVTATSTGFLVFLDVPNLLQTKVPFAWFYEIKRIIDAQASRTETGAFPSLSIGTASTSAFVMSVEILSEDTIDNSFLPAGFITTFRTLFAASLWLSLATMMFFTVRKLV